MANKGIFLQGVPLERAKQLEWSHIDEYQEAALKFPDAKSCEVEQSLTNNLNIDWDRVGSLVELEICISRIVGVLGTPRAVEAWLKSEGFVHVMIRPAVTGDVHADAAEKIGSIVESTWLSASRHKLVHGLWHSLMQRVNPADTSIVIFISETRKVISVKCTYNSL